MHGLNAPAAADQLIGQPVEQLGMAGTGAHVAEIVGSSDDAASEVIIPEAVGHHPGGEGVLGVGDPAGQQRARGLGFERQLGGAVGQQHAQRPHPHRFALVLIIAPGQDVDRRQLLRVVRDGEERGQGLRLARFDLRQLRLQLLAGLALQAAHGRAHLPDFLLHPFHLGLPGGLLLGRGQGYLLVPGSGEVGLEAVVVFLADGIELVVVAAGAPQGDAEHAGADHVGHLGQDLVARAGHLLVAGILAQRTETVESGGDAQHLVARVDLVAGELLGEEAVVGLVGVERLDHVIAETPGVLAVGVILEAVAFGEADYVEPMLTPAFAVVGVVEQALDQLLVGVRGPVVDEGADLGGGRRQAEQVEIDTPDEGEPVGLGRRAQALLLQTGENEGVNGILDPGAIGGVGELGEGGLRPFLKRPVAALGRGVLRRSPAGHRGGGENQYPAHVTQIIQLGIP